MPVAAPPDGGAASTSQAGKAGQSAASGADTFAALFADLQTADTHGDAAADPNAASLPDGSPAGRASHRQRSGLPDDAALPNTSNVIDLIAWVKANAGQEVATKFARIQKKGDTSGPSDSPAPSAKKDSTDPNAEQIVVPIAMPNAAATPIAPLRTSFDVARSPESVDARETDDAALLGTVAAQQGQAAGQSRVSAALDPADPAADKHSTGQPNSDLPTNGLPTPALKRSASANAADAAALRAALRAIATQSPASEDGSAAPSVATTKGASSAGLRPAADADSRAVALNALRATLAGAERPNVTESTPAAEGKDSQAPQAGDASPSRQGGTGAGQQNAQNNHSFDLAAAVTPTLPLADLQAHLAKMLDAAQAQVVASTERGVPAPPVNATSIAAAMANVPDADLSRQIVQGVRLQWRDGVGEAKITLQPDYLGSVSVSLRVSDGGVTATLHADSPAVRSWIETNEPSLRQALADQGLTLHRLTIVDEPAQASNQNGREPGAQQGQQQQQQPQRQQRRRQGDGETFESLM
jgi:flagellar hook-length control protein FliK